MLGSGNNILGNKLGLGFSGGSLVGQSLPITGSVDNWSPYSLGPAAAFDASDLSSLTVDASNRVSQWSDKSGFARHLLQATGSAQPLLLPWRGANYLFCPGVVSNSASTPNSGALSITGDIDIRAKLSLVDWTPTSDSPIVGKMVVPTAYKFIVRSTGVLRFTAGGKYDADSTVGTGVADGATKWVRAVRNKNAGTVIFYLSDDGVTWTQLGATVTGLDTTAMQTNTGALYVGDLDASATNSLSGKVYYADVRNNILNDGTGIVATFDPSQAAHNATSWVSSTGETWTVNQSGATPAQIVGRSSVLFDGSAYYMKCSAFTLNQPETVYLVGKRNTFADGRTVFDGNASNSMRLLEKTTTPHTRIYSGGAGDTADDANWAIGANAVATCVFNSAASLNRVNLNAGATGDPGSTGAGGFTLAAVGAGTSAWDNIQAQEALIFSAAHDTTTQNRVIQYLGRKWGFST